MVSPFPGWVNRCLPELVGVLFRPEPFQRSERCSVPCSCREFSGWRHLELLQFFLRRCCWKEPSEPRGARGLALAPSPGSGNSSSARAFLLFSPLLFPWRSAPDPSPPPGMGMSGLFQHSCVETPHLWIKSWLSPFPGSVIPSIRTQHPPGRDLGFLGAEEPRALPPLLPGTG